MNKNVDIEEAQKNLPELVSLALCKRCRDL